MKSRNQSAQKIEDFLRTDFFSTVDILSKAKKKAEPAQVKIGRVSRGKKKSVTHITGLASYEVYSKKNNIF